MSKIHEIEFLVGSPEGLQDIQREQPLEIFSSLLIDFWSQVSVHLLADKRSKAFPDVVTFAFYCRKANLLNLQKSYIHSGIRLGRGVVFHIAPSNVPVNFAYSLLVGMLAGNANVVRVSTKFFEQVEIICNAMRVIIEKDFFVALRDRLHVVRYPRDPVINEKFSLLSDVRVIWGGDSTITEIRKAPLPPKCYDITFSDRYSCALISADAILAQPDLTRLARAFYNDTYLFDQNACSAPHLIIWHGNRDKVEIAKTLFWSAIKDLLNDYEIEPIIAIDKLATLCIHSSDPSGIELSAVDSNKLWRIQVQRLTEDVDRHRCSSGYFLEYTTEDLHQVAVAVNRKYQTLAYFGFTKIQLREWLLRDRLLGIDRVVPIGKTTDFDLIWDGHDLIRALSRECIFV
ncbi:acyl-CoA reductase [Polynucleobacter paneuropaeus]|nr:acyl-CoA reductase [Polynucleobacter paneuropaeus]